MPVQQFLRWAGSKRKLLPHILPLLGLNDSGTYYEPFLGSGAVFFALEPSRAVLSDMNPDLIAGYLALQEYPDELIQRLSEHESFHNQNPKEYYYAIRSEGNIDPGKAWSKASLLDKGSRFIYLNRATFNGLWRVNLKGEMNAPIGANSKKSRSIAFDFEDLRHCSTALSVADIRRCSYEEIFPMVQWHDRVYLDPPYVPIQQKTNFSGYCSSSFNFQDQLNLLKLCRQSSLSYSAIVLSNANTDVTQELYSGLSVEFLEVSRSIAAKTGDRRIAKELIVSF